MGDRLRASGFRLQAAPSGVFARTNSRLGRLKPRTTCSWTFPVAR